LHGVPVSNEQNDDAKANPQQRVVELIENENARELPQIGENLHECEAGGDHT